MGSSRESVSSSPQIEEHVGLLVQNDLDIAGVDQGVVHLVPLSIAGLSIREEMVQEIAVSRWATGHLLFYLQQRLTAFSAKPKLSILEYWNYKGMVDHTH